MTQDAVPQVPFPDPKDRAPTILIVEDEILIRLTLSDFLQECGFKVIEASNAAEAIAIVEANTVTLDLVFTDVRMPGDMDGFGLARWIRQNRPGLSVIITSGDAKKSQAAHKLCAEEHFVAKPYDLKRVVAHLRQTIDARKKTP